MTHTTTPTTKPTPLFTDLLKSSPLKSRNDFAQACISLLEPLLPFFSPGCTRIRLGATATRFDEGAAQLEGFTRSLWGLAPLLSTLPAATFSPNDQLDSPPPFLQKLSAHYLTGLRNGTNPSHAEFWGYALDSDQRMVEMCPLAFALIVAPQHFWEPLTDKEKDDVESWLAGVNERGMPDTNWLWFRVMANLAMEVNGRGTAEKSASMRRDLSRLDRFYRSEGWSNDGPEGYTQMDYYSGSFAIQLLQLIYVKVKGKDGTEGEEEREEKERCERYKAWAREFATGFVRYFDEEGRAITFGRSLTYRFAMAGVWAAVAFADLELPEPLTWGVMKGLLLRDLRWWTQQKDILTPQGTLTIGYSYPNQFLSENYNSPGSPYWFMLSFIALACPADHPFWQAEEQPYPSDSVPDVEVLKEPKHIMVRKGGHTFLLSSGQQCHYPMRASESKYGKFAYSSAFGYSVPTGGYFVQAIGGDNTLALSDDEGETWKVRRVALDARIEEREGTPVLLSGWRPWKDVCVETILVPPADDAPNWHVRAHRIKSGRSLLLSEGAWALNGESKVDGRMIGALQDEENGGREEAEGESLAVTIAGAVGIAELVGKRQGVVLDEDANSNLLSSRSVLPTLTAEIRAAEEKTFVAGIFAVPSSAESWQKRWRSGWQHRPSLPRWLLQEMSDAGS